MTLVWPNGTTIEPARSDGYGPRASIQTKEGPTRPFHVGTDHVGIGRVRSIGDGTVIESGRYDHVAWAGYQILIYLGEIDGVRTWVRMCHFQGHPPQSRGDTVRVGDFIGLEGDTGQSAGVHLHWEIYRGRVDRGTWGDPGATVDPRAFVLAHLATPNPAQAEEEDEDMSRPTTIAKVTKGTEVEVTTFWPDGEEHVFGSTNTAEGQSYNRNVALAYGCAPQMPIIYITASHYDKIKAENAEARSRPGVGRA